VNLPRAKEIGGFSGIGQRVERSEMSGSANVGLVSGYEKENNILNNPR
jgi:hypothetical protein